MGGDDIPEANEQSNKTDFSAEEKKLEEKENKRFNNIFEQIKNLKIASDKVDTEHKETYEKECKEFRDKYEKKPEVVKEEVVPEPKPQEVQGLANLFGEDSDEENL